MPGTMAELVERTGYPAETILKMIHRMRAEGVRVNARAGESFIGDQGREYTPTTYEIAVDSSSGKE